MSDENAVDERAPEDTDGEDPEPDDATPSGTPDGSTSESDTPPGLAEVEQRVEAFLTESERQIRESLGLGIGSAAADIVVGPSAPVVLPPESKMKVRVLPVADLHRLDESRSDSGLMLSFVLMFGGAILGFLTTMLVAEEVEFTRWTNTFLGLLSFVALLFLALYIRASVRGARLRKEIFRDDQD